MTEPSPIKVKVDGDAVGGWIVEIHDGERLRVYSPEEGKAETPEVAADHGEEQYLAEFPAAKDRLFERTLPVTERDEDDDPVDTAAADEAAKRARAAALAQRKADKPKGGKRTRTETAKAPTVADTGKA